MDFIRCASRMALQAKLSVVGWRLQPMCRDKSMRRMTIILFLRESSEFGPPQTTHGIFMRRLENFLRALEVKRMQI